MIKRKASKISKRERILTDTGEFSRPASVLIDTFGEVSISESLKIKDSTILDRRYFVGVESKSHRRFKNLVTTACTELGMPKDSFSEISSIKSPNEFYAGVQETNGDTSYRVYLGFFDDEKSSGDGIAIEWKNKKNKFSTRKYTGETIDSFDSINRKSIEALSGDQEKSDKIMEFLMSVASEEDFVAKSNLVRSHDDIRNSIDISLVFSSQKIYPLKEKITGILESFNVGWRDYYKFFLPPTRSMMLTRIQWGTDSSREAFANIYFG